MRQTDISQLFAVPFGAQADSTTISAIPQTATAIGRASMALGFPKATMTPLAAGGNPPYGEDMNGILNMLSRAAQAAELGLLRPFSATYAEAIGGYPAGATVAHPGIAGRFLICTQDGNSNDPSQNMTGWVDPLAQFQPAGDYLPRVNPVVSGTLNVETIDSNTSQIDVWHGPSNQFRTSLYNDGRLIGFNPSGGLLWALGTDQSQLSGPLGVTDTQGSTMALTPTDTVYGQRQGSISWGASKWYLGGDSQIVAPNGSWLAQSAASAGATLINRFSISGIHGQWISFPQQFSSDDVQLAIVPLDSANGRIHVANYFSVNRYGFSLSLNSVSSGSVVNETNPTPLTIIATGAP